MCKISPSYVDSNKFTLTSCYTFIVYWATRPLSSKREASAESSMLDVPGPGGGVDEKKHLNHVRVALAPAVAGRGPTGGWVVFSFFWRK